MLHYHLFERFEFGHFALLGDQDGERVIASDGDADGRAEHHLCSFDSHERDDRRVRVEIVVGSANWARALTHSRAVAARR